MDNQSKVIRCCVSKLFMNKICLHRNDQTETHTTKYNTHTKTILIRFSFRSRWIIFSRIDVWPLILFMCIFYKIPITFKFPIAAAAHILQYSNIYHVKMYVFLLNVHWEYRNTNFLRLGNLIIFCHPGHSQFTNQQFICSILFHFFCVWSEDEIWGTIYVIYKIRQNWLEPELCINKCQLMT